MKQKNEQTSLVLDRNIGEENIAYFVNYLRENSVDKIHIGPNCTLSNFDFLTEFSCIKEIKIDSMIDIDLYFLNKMKQLRKLSGDPFKLYITIDIRSLQSLYCTWTPKFGLSEKCSNLMQLGITGCNNSDNLWEDLCKLEKLNYLAIAKGNMHDCKEFKKMKKLKELRLLYLPKLNSLSGIEVLNDTITDLWIQTGKKITDYTPLSRLVNLETLVISNHSVIEDIGFVKKMKKLNSLRIINTKITDTNIEYLSNIPQVSFLNTGIDNKLC